MTRLLGFLVCAGGAFAADNLLTGAADPTAVAPHDGTGIVVVSTGRGLPIRFSSDGLAWKQVGRVFDDDAPAWAREKVPGAKGIWAPDISYHDELYHVYYSVSTFGSQRSVIGLAVNKTLDPREPDYEWVDRGLVIESAPGACDFNAIDPALFTDRDGRWYLFWGSFWTGIKMTRIDPKTGKPFAANEPILPVAGRAQGVWPPAIEAPYVIVRGDYYYLFVSWGSCCDGADSTYEVRVGRSKSVTGPYTDRANVEMKEGGGTLVLKGDERWRGPGHNGVLTTAKGQWLVHHTYDMQHLDAKRILQIRPLTWTADDWPAVGEPIEEPVQFPTVGRS